MKKSSSALIGLIAAIIGAIVGSAISGTITYRIFAKQVLVAQYAVFAEDIEKAFTSASMRKSDGIDESRREELKTEAELHINRAWSRALVTLPDNVFLEIDKMITRETMNAGTRNRVYFLLRQELYPETAIEFDNIMTRRISLKE